MGALISLFVSLTMMLVSTTMSLLMTVLNLSVSLLTRGARGRRGSGASATGVIALVLVAVVVFGLLLEHPGWMVTLAIVGVVLWLLLRKTGPRTPNAQELSQRFGQIPFMSGGQFEVFVADLMRAMGYRATVMGGSGDQGVDVIAVAESERIAIQCKNYKKAVGNRPVQEVFAGARHHGCQRAWVVAPAGFTKGAPRAGPQRRGAAFRRQLREDVDQAGRRGGQAERRRTSEWQG